ncbi:MAG: serine protease [Candidatus Spechtbacterales bacterium]
MSLQEKVKGTRASVVAIGFSPAPGRVTITGSGFCISDDGKILTVAHIYNQTPLEFQPKLMAMVMTEQEERGLERYAWRPLSLIGKDDKNDVAVFQVKDCEQTLLKPLELGDSEDVEVGQDMYFVGFPYAAQLMNEGFGITLIVNKAIVSNVKQDGQDPEYPRNWFIVDAISNPGNSGAPLIDAETNRVVGVMSIAFSIRSQNPKYSDLDIRGPMHIAGAKPINAVKGLLGGV